MQSDCITITHYGELQTFLRMFKEKDVGLLLIESSPGLGKTACIQEALKGVDYHLMASHVTPLQNHIELYENRNKLIVYEDVTQLLASRVSLSTMKQLCETRRIKQLHYHSTSQRLTVPPVFETASTVLITMNELSAGDKTVQALLSRGLHIKFQPPKQEILQKMKEILEKIDVVALNKEQRQEVLAFIEKNTAYASNFNLRTLVRGLAMRQYALKDKGFDWKANLAKLMDVDVKLREVMVLMKTGRPVKQQIEQYSRSESDYYRTKRKLSRCQGNEKIR